MRHFVQILAVFGSSAAMCAAVPPSAAAQAAPRTSLRATRVAVSPKLDGLLDDEAWSRPPLPLDTWISYNPMRGEPATQRTDVWVAYDDEAIYFAFKCFDNEPGKIRTTISRRDSAYSDDWVAISLDSSRAGQVAYHMFVNPSGIQMDALNTGSNGEDNAPDWIWQSAGRSAPTATRWKSAFRSRASAFAAGRTSRWACCSSATSAGPACPGRRRPWRLASGCSNQTCR